MFNVNDTVVYSNLGVCVISDIRKEKIHSKSAVYYVLSPVDDANMTVYCPVDNHDIKMRRLLGKDEIIALIKSMPKLGVEWISDDRRRNETYKEILRNGSQEDLIGLIRTLYHHKKETEAKGKKFHSADEKIMREAERMIYGEFAHMLNISRDEVIPFIADEIELKE